MAQDRSMNSRPISRVRRGYALLSVLGVGLLGLISGFAWQASLYPAIPIGVRVGSLPIGGLPPQEARQLLEQHTRRWLQATWQLEAGPVRRECRLADLGASFEVEDVLTRALDLGRKGSFWQRCRTRLQLYREGLALPLLAHVPEPRLTALLQEMASQVRRDPLDARVLIRGDSIRVQPHRMGWELDRERARAALQDAFRSGIAHPISLPVRETLPRITTDDLRSLDTLLVRFSTRFNPGKRSRTHNLGLAAAAINGTVLKPGETFSYNQVVGERSSKAGFRLAPIFVQGRLSEGIGGGVCQVSSTLYNAALLAGLKIVERRPHSRPVDYLPAGRDATVVYGGSDLKFQANTSHPIYITAGREGNQIVVRIFGSREDRREVQVVSARDGVIPSRMIEIPDPSLPTGKKVVEDKGSTGYRTRTYRVYLEGGREVRRELVSRDVYPAQPRRVRVGTAPSPQPELKEPVSPGERPLGRQAVVAAPQPEETSNPPAG